MPLFGKSKKNKKDAAVAVVDGGTVSIASSAAAADKDTEAELAAVFAAAIAAYEDDMGAGVRTNLYIRKIDRSAGVRPAWGVAGNRESIESCRI
jgi:hypothetical protein